MSITPPEFTPEFREQLHQLFLWRRDVRRFRPDAIPARLVDELLATACLAPSVGNSQPWRFVTVDDPERRRGVIENFETCNAEALADYSGDMAGRYASLKLEGLREAPVHLAVFHDTASSDGHGLGSRTMPDTRAFSVVAAVHTLWLAARALGIGLGWVSILDPHAVGETLDVPSGWHLIAYLCLGYPQEDHLDPELVRHDWQERRLPEELLLKR